MPSFSVDSVETSRENLESFRDVIDSFFILYAQVKGKLSLNQAYDLLKDKTFFYLGESMTGKAGS